MANNLLGKLAKKTATAEVTTKKDETPIVEIEGSEKNKLAVEKLVAAKRAIKQAESTVQQSEEVLLPTCKEARKKHCMEKQAFTSTVKVKVAGTDLETVSFQTQNRYSEIPITSGEKLEAIFGTEFNRSFNTITSIEVTPAGLKELEKENSELLEKLMTAVGGPEEFGKKFKVSQILKPTDYLHEQSVQDAKVASLLDKAISEGLVKPVKPSFRVS